MDPNVYALELTGDIGWAVKQLQNGERVARRGWNGKGMYLLLVRHYTVNFTAIDLLPWVGMKTADEKFVPWLASQTDILATDWEVV